MSARNTHPEHQRATTNHHARFHPMEQPDSLPCLELAGILVFVYLDREHGRLYVSLDLEDTKDWLTHGENVPVQVRTGDASVLDYTPRPHSTRGPTTTQGDDDA